MCGAATEDMAYLFISCPVARDAIVLIMKSHREKVAAAGEPLGNFDIAHHVFEASDRPQEHDFFRSLSISLAV